MIMKSAKLLFSVVVAGLFAFSGVASAVVYDFGSLLSASSGYNAPNSFQANPFAQLSATDNGSGIWTFELKLNNSVFSSFGTGTFISSNVDGVTSVKSTNGTGLSGLTDIDFGTAFGQGANNRLSQNDWVKWSVSGLYLGSSLTNMYLHVQGIDGGYSAKYTPVVSAVPEPETYAMLLIGLGLIGFSARRRKHLNE
jgi:hypothetical protein